MKDEQLVAIIFLIVGMAAGFISKHFNTFLSITFCILIYLSVAIILFNKFIKDRKLITDSLVIFILVWILIWVILNNV
jgi:hypothetical protein